MLSGLLITIDILVCISLIGVVLMQRSEGGAFGTGGNPGGLITARGAGDLLTRTTWVLFAAFLVLSIVLTLHHEKSSFQQGLKQQTANPDALAPPAPVNAAPSTPLSGPLTGPSLPGAPLQAPAPASAPVAAPAATPKPHVAAAAAVPAKEKPATSAGALPTLDLPPPPPPITTPVTPAPAAPTTQPSGSAPQPKGGAGGTTP